MKTVTASAHPNLALVKYWGKTGGSLNLALNNSISINLGKLTTTTQVTFEPKLGADVVRLNGSAAEAQTQQRVSEHLDRVRQLAQSTTFAVVDSRNDFPQSAGLASSASAFAALSLAATRALDLDLGEKQLSMLARTGSGSACRSIAGGFVEWIAGESDSESYARQLHSADHWDLVVTSVVLEKGSKEVSSTRGHEAARTSPLFQARLDVVPEVLSTVRRALRQKDLAQLGMAVEREAVQMHAIAMTSTVPGEDWKSGVYYWSADTLKLIQAVQSWRREGLAVYFTIDAGANVHLLHLAEDGYKVEQRLQTLFAGETYYWVTSQPGRGAWVENTG